MTVAQSQLSVKKSAGTTRPEIELLLCCARTQIDPVTDQRIKELLQQDIDWVYLINKSLRYRIALIMYWNLNTLYSDAVPKAILAQLRNIFHKNVLRNLFLTQELVKLLNLLKEHEIDAIPFKGPVLTLSAYGNLGLRQFSDLDILVHQEDFIRTKNLLIAKGYLYDGQYEESALQCQLYDGLITVDLHYGIPPKDLQLNSKYFWDCLEPLSIQGNKILTLSPEAQLLILCIEGYKEPRRWLDKICDLAALIRFQQEIDWERIIAIGTNLKINQILYLGLLLAHELLDAPLPEKIRQMVKTEKIKIIQMVKNDPVKRLLITKLREQFLDETHSINIKVPSTYLRFLDPVTYLGLLDFHHLEHLAITEGLSDRIKYCFSCTFTPTPADRELLSLPKSVSFLYYIVRPIRLIGKYGLRLFKRDSQIS